MGACYGRRARRRAHAELEPLQLLVLHEVVRDLEPRRLRADEDVLRRADARIVRERTERDVHVGALADDRVEERAADAATRVIPVVVAPDEQRVRALDDLELLALDPGERLERGA